MDLVFKLHRTLDGIVRENPGQTSELVFVKIKIKYQNSIVGSGIAIRYIVSTNPCP